MPIVVRLLKRPPYNYIVSLGDLTIKRKIVISCHTTQGAKASICRNCQVTSVTTSKRFICISCHVSPTYCHITLGVSSLMFNLSVSKHKSQRRSLICCRANQEANANAAFATIACVFSTNSRKCKWSFSLSASGGSDSNPRTSDHRSIV